MPLRKLLILLVIGHLCSARLPAQSPFAPKVSGPLSQRVVAYQIDAKYDPAHHTVDATETLTYHNLTGQPLIRFPFHLYLNAFQPKSTWMHEAHRDGSFRTSQFDTWDPKEYGSNEVTSFEVVGMGDLTRQMKFVSPDDGNPDDKTVFEVQLPRPVAPGQDVQFKIKFRAKFPEVVARTGYKRTFLLAGQWFPKVGVWWHGAWNCHQFHAMTEFFADFGTYDVRITVPKNYVIGATGVQTSDTDNGDGTKTVAFHAEDVHDFAWTADPNFKVIESEFNGSVGPVRIRLLSYTSHKGSWQRYLDVMQGTMQRFDQWYGPYPYAQITVVDPPHGADEAGGMEYPTFITAGTGWFASKGDHETEGVTEHEFGHQYWYGMVATNEFENGWLDEGINSYTEVKVLDNMYGHNASGLNLLGAQLGDASLLRSYYLPVADTDSLARPSYTDLSASSYGGVTYGKTACALLTLEALVGEQTLRNALHIVFHEVSLHSPHPGRLHAHGKRSCRPGPELVLATGCLWNPGLRLRGTARRLNSNKLVRRKRKRKAGRDNVRDAGHSATQRRLRLPRRGRNQVRQRRESFANAGTARTAGCASCITRRRRSRQSNSIPTTRSRWMATI